MLNYILYGTIGLCAALAAPTAIDQSMLFVLLYVDYSVNAQQNPNEFKPTNKLQYVSNYGKELFYSLGNHYNRPYKYSDLAIHVNEADTAILLIHGYSRNQSDWLWLRNQFSSSDCSVFSVNIHSSLGINKIAENDIALKIQEIKQKYGIQKFILVGASMGGLVASYYKENLDLNKDVLGVITLGSPFYGTKVAAVGNGDSLKQMCTDSEFLKKLRNHIKDNKNVYYQVASRFDEVIFPWNSALLTDVPKEQQFIVPFEGHLGLLHNDDVAVKLNSWIQQIKSANNQAKLKNNG